MSCGADEHAQLGHAAPDEQGRCCELRAVALPLGVRGLAQASCGARHAVALTDDARVVSWGSAEGGLLGRRRADRGGGAASRSPGSGRESLPAVVPWPEYAVIASVSAARHHSLAVTHAGALWLWGRVAEKMYVMPTPVRGEQLGSAHFLRACATECAWR